MTDAQLYVAIGVPVIFNGLGFILLTFFMNQLSTRMGRLEDRVLALENRVNQFEVATVKTVGTLQTEVALLKQGFDIVLKKLEERERP